MSFSFTSQDMAIIETAFIFRNVDEVIVERIVTDDRCRFVLFDKGQEIYNEENFNHALGIILSGKATVEKNTLDDRRLSISTLEPGMCFGAAAMFHKPGNYLNVITAAKPCEVLFLPEELLLWAMQRNPQITENYIAYLSERIWFLNNRIAVLTAGTSEQKILTYLSQTGETECSMTELSRELNIGRASLYRGLEALEKEKRIERTGKKIRLL